MEEDDADQAAAARDQAINQAFVRRERQLPPRYYRNFFDHQRWLQTGGRFGERLALRPTSPQSKTFINRDMSAFDFSKAVLVNVTFRSCTLKEARFLNANLQGVIFLNCELDRADFSGARLSEVSFGKSNYQAARFENIEAGNIDWNGERPIHRERDWRKWPKPDR